MPATQTALPRRKARQRKSPWWRLAPALLMISGIVVMLYPVVATQYNNHRQHSFAAKYNEDVQQVSSSDLAADLDQAHAYNDTLSGIPILDPWLQQVSSSPGSQAYKSYLNQLSRFDVMARLQVPTAKIDLPVYHGTTDSVLSKGVGHLYGTSLPVGGSGTHSVLTSHTGLATATLFDNLSSVKIGDMFYVTVLGETLAYRVDEIKVVLPNEIDDLTAVAGHDYLTLFTCTPYAVNTHRLLVRGERVPYDQSIELSASQFAFTMEPWMWILLAGALAGVSVMVFTMVSRRR